MVDLDSVPLQHLLAPEFGRLATIAARNVADKPLNDGNSSTMLPEYPSTLQTKSIPDRPIETIVLSPTGEPLL